MSADKTYEKLKAMPLRDVARWIETRHPRGRTARDQFRALARLMRDIAQIDFLSRKPDPENPEYKELKRRADMAMELAQNYRAQLKGR